MSLCGHMHSGTLGLGVKEVREGKERGVLTGKKSKQ